MDFKIEPGKNRLPLIRNEEMVDELDNLDDEQKALGKKNFSMLPPTEGWMMLGNDPDCAVLWQVFERTLTSLMGGDMQASPFGFMNLSTMIIAKEMGNEYTWGCMSAGLMSAIPDHGYGYRGMVKNQMLDYPDCDCWTDEERLCMKFTKAMIKSEMTDEIMQEAIDSWGSSMVVRRMSWICYIVGMSMMQQAMNMKYDIETEIFPYGTWTPENVKMTVDNLMDTKDQLRKFWTEDLNTFVSAEKEMRAKAAAEGLE
ncbi:MAG: hypothetical protein LUE92_04390 [Clostridiales bacterium]|nr:hypothetical protein [Clostridiales bacterium]